MLALEEMLFAVKASRLKAQKMIKPFLACNTKITADIISVLSTFS